MMDIRGLLSDPQFRLGLGLLGAAGPMPAQVGFGQRAMMGVGSFDEWDAQQRRLRMLEAEEKRRAEETAYQNKVREAALQKVLQEEEQKRASDQFIRTEAERLLTPQFPLGTSVISTDPAKQPQNVTPTLPQFNILETLKRAPSLEAAKSLQELLPQAKKPEFKVVGNNLVRIAGDKVSEAYRAPSEQKFPSAVQEYQFAVGQGYKGTFEQWDRERKRAGATSVTVAPQFNTGEKGFKHSTDLASAFKQEPIYKAHQEVTSAYGQIRAALENPSGASDLAAATKFMKLLDPGSVVRESELVMAMSTSGLLDRMANYANMIITGQKLTPTQRAQFREMTDKLFEESRSLYNQKRQQYGSVANKYGLDAEILPAESVPRVKIGPAVDYKKLSDSELMRLITEPTP